MKLTKDQIQKIALGGMLLCGVIYGYFEFILSPIKKSSEAVIKKTQTLEPQIAAAQAQIEKTKLLESQAPAAEQLISQVNSLIPEGAPVAWFPPRVVDFFRERGMEKVTARMNNENQEKELTGFRRLSWGIELGRVEFVPFAAALAEFENREPLLEIQSCEVEAARDDSGKQRVTLNLNNIVHL